KASASAGGPRRRLGQRSSYISGAGAGDEEVSSLAGEVAPGGRGGFRYPPFFNWRHGAGRGQGRASLSFGGSAPNRVRGGSPRGPDFNRQGVCGVGPEGSCERQQIDPSEGIR